MKRQSLLALRKTAHSDPFSRLSAQVGARNAHSDPFPRLSAQVGVRTAHSDQKYRLSRRIIKKLAAELLLRRQLLHL